MAEDVKLQINPGKPLFPQLVDQIIVLSFEIQSAFADRYGDLSWRADLSEPGVFWFEREPAAVFRPHFLGSSSGSSHTWMWGWNNINHYPDSVVETVLSVQGWGEQLTCPELRVAKQPLDATERSRAGLLTVGAADQSLVFAAAALSGLRVPAYYRAPVGGGSFAWFLLDNDQEFTLASASAVPTAAALSQAVSSGYLSDPRAAVWAYGARREGVEIADDGEALLVSANDGELRVEFDELGRVSLITGMSE